MRWQAMQRAVLQHVRSRLSLKLSIPIALILFLGVLIWSFYHIRHQSRFARENLIISADRVASTVQQGLHYAMMLNNRDDIRAIVENCGKLVEIRGIRIFNKHGDVMFSADSKEVGNHFGQDEHLCQTCHAHVPPTLAPGLRQRLYSETSLRGEQVLRLASPIPNEPGCSDASGCHFHKPEDKILGVLDISFSTSQSEALVDESLSQTFWLAAILFAASASALFLLVHVCINRPIQRIVEDAAILSKGESPRPVAMLDPDELGQLSAAVRAMGMDLISKNNQLGRQKDMYQDLFEGVPCLMTVQDKDYRLLRFNRTFQERFAATRGEFCYKAYKNLDAKCPDCPVERTFLTGKSQRTEESGCYKDGSRAHWIVTTAPIYDDNGDIVAAMEMCLDITERKELEREIKRSEKKYCDIFNNIPSAVFVLDQADHGILDVNRGAVAMYGYSKAEFLGMSFLELFVDANSDDVIRGLEAGQAINQARHHTRDGREFFVGINSSPSEFFDRKVHLVTVSDVTKRLEAEQQLIQASKMATLGEMATGVAHEINQPLAVIQTSVDLIRRRLVRGEMPEQPLLNRMTELVTTQIERATRIINHMREFGRKAELHLESVNLNDVLTRCFDFFGQQLALRSIEVFWDLDDKLPPVRCEPNRMEQVFINFLLNARDAIEEHAARAEHAAKAEHASRGDQDVERRITIKTMHNQGWVTLRIADTGGGIPESIRDRIFEPFFTTKQVGKGTGLGLSISYGIIKDYGGEIHVTGNEHGGASFHVRLPVAKEDLPPGKETA